MRSPGLYDPRPGTPKKAQPPAIMNPLRALHIAAKAEYKRRFYLLRKVSPQQGETVGPTHYPVSRVLADHRGRRYQELKSGTLVRVLHGRTVSRRERRENKRAFAQHLRHDIRQWKRANGGRRFDLSAGGAS